MCHQVSIRYGCNTVHHTFFAVDRFPTDLTLAPAAIFARRGAKGTGMSEAMANQVEAQLKGLRIDHRDLDAAIEALRANGSADQLQVARLKKRKLRLRDEIALIEDQLIPDIIA